MALINVLDIRFLNNPAPITAPYEIEIQFECLDALAHDLEWKLIYVGSGFSEDVELDSLLVGPIPTGVNKFVFTADPVDVSQIPSSDVLGVSVILLTASYDDREFVRVGFYNNNEYVAQDLREKYDKLLAEGTDEERAVWKFEGVKNVDVQRNILTAKPRVTRFNIKWDNENFNDEPPEQEELEGDEVVALDQLGEGDEEDEDEEEEEAGQGAAANESNSNNGHETRDESSAGPSNTTTIDATNADQEEILEDEEDEGEDGESGSDGEDSDEAEEDIEIGEDTMIEDVKEDQPGSSTTLADSQTLPMHSKDEAMT